MEEGPHPLLLNAAIDYAGLSRLWVVLAFVYQGRVCFELAFSSRSPRGSFSSSLSPPTAPPPIYSYNGCLASGDKGRRRSRLALSRRPHANGVKPDVMHHISTPLVSKASSLPQWNGCHPVLCAQAQVFSLPRPTCPWPFWSGGWVGVGVGGSTVSLLTRCLLAQPINGNDGAGEVSAQ